MNTCITSDMKHEGPCITQIDIGCRGIAIWDESEFSRIVTFERFEEVELDRDF